jgi:ABC-type glycerol-3-phosphate transport system permease component
VTAGYFERIGAYTVLTLFSVLAIYPVLSIVFLALHRKTDLVTGFAFPTRLDLSSF